MSEEELIEFRDHSLIGFELKLPDTEDISSIFYGDDYWMVAIEDDDEILRLRGVELKTWNVVLVTIYRGSRYMYVCLPNRGDVKIVMRIADKLHAEVYGNGKLMYSPAGSMNDA